MLGQVGRVVWGVVLGGKCSLSSEQLWNPPVFPHGVGVGRDRSLDPALPGVCSINEISSVPEPCSDLNCACARLAPQGGYNAVLKEESWRMQTWTPDLTCWTAKLRKAS